MDGMDKQYDRLNKFFMECVRYWERTLDVDSNLDNSAYVKALGEIPSVDPYVPNGEPFDADVLERFKKHRYMDCYGRAWEIYYAKDNGKA